MNFVCTLLAETTLEVRIENAQSDTFESNIGSPQGDSISGPLFTLYLNEAPQQIKDEIQKEPIDYRDTSLRWVEMTESNIPEEIVYADYCDFITKIEKRRKGHMRKQKKY